MARKARVSTTRTGRGKWVAVEKILPESAVLDLRQAANAADEITAQLVSELDARFEIERRYGVTKLRLRNYLRREKQSAPETSELKPGADRAIDVEPAPTPTEPPSDSVPPELDQDQSPSEAHIAAYRQRQASLETLLDAVFGQFAASDPELWDRRAYLMLVGLVYERLATNEAELATADLVALSKVLAENRRAEAQSHKKTQTDDESQEGASPSDELPEHFAETVRQVYGTNFQMPERATVPGE